MAETLTMTEEQAKALDEVLRAADQWIADDSLGSQSELIESAQAWREAGSPGLRLSDEERMLVAVKRDPERAAETLLTVRRHGRLAEEGSSYLRNWGRVVRNAVEELL
jgi:hypothetical protein